MDYRQAIYCNVIVIVLPTTQIMEEYIQSETSDCKSMFHPSNQFRRRFSSLIKHWRIFDFSFPLQISWIRHRDLLILTVATYTFTTDQRFQTAYHRDTNEWTLHIKWVQPADAGMYECQISTQPIVSYFVQLNTIGAYNEVHKSSLDWVHWEWLYEPVVQVNRVTHNCSHILVVCVFVFNWSQIHNAVWEVMLHNLFVIKHGQNVCSVGLSIF